MPKTAYKHRGLGLSDVAQNVAHPEQKVPYLVKRGNTYSFNRRAPDPLKPGQTAVLGDRVVKIGKNGYIRFPLETTDKKLAARRARKYAHLIDEVVAHPPSARPDLHVDDRSPNPSGVPTKAEIEYAAATMRTTLLAADESSLAIAVASVFEGETDLREPDRYLWSQEDLPPASAAGQALLLKRLARIACWYIYQTTRKTIDKPGPELLPFADEFRRFVADMNSRAAGIPIQMPTVPSAPKPDWSWEQAIQYYFSQRSAAKGTRSIYAGAWDSLAEFAKCPPGALHFEQVVGWKDSVLRKAVAPTTAKNRLGAAAAIWRESRTAGHIPRGTPDPFEGLTVRVPQSRTSSRVQFDQEEMRVIFAADPAHTQRAVSVHAGYWIPVLAAYYGARLEELTGLEVADIVNTPDGLSFWIRPNTTRNIKGGARAARKLPLHPTVSRLGFETYCQAAKASGVTHLFPSLSSAQSFGECFVEHVTGLLNPSPGRLIGLHCFRHAWETAKRNAQPNFDYSVARYICGRSIDAGSAAAYGSEAGLPKILSELSKIDHGISHKLAPEVTPKMLKDQERNRDLARRAGKQRKSSMALEHGHDAL